MTACAKKVRYRDEIAARLALASAPAMRRRDSAKTEARAYRCPICRGWHLTSQRKRRGAAS